MTSSNSADGSNNSNGGPQWYVATRVPVSMDLSALVKHLRQRRIPIHISEEQGQQVLWVARREDVQPLLEMLERWQQGRIHFEHDNVNAGNVKAGSKARNSNAFLANTRLAFHRFPITCGLLIVSGFGALATRFEPFLFIYYWFAFVDFLQPQPQSLFEPLLQSQVWRLFTPMFLHFGVTHLIFNAVLLWVFGSRIEIVLGRWHFLALVFVASASANIGQYFWEQDPRFGGMSGVNYGLIGYIWIRQMFAPNVLLAMPKGLVTLMLAWLLLGIMGVIDFLMQARIANGAHLGGLLLGTLWGALHGWYSSHKKPH